MDSSIFYILLACVSIVFKSVFEFSNPYLLKINENQMQEENIDYEDLYQASFEDIKEEINIDEKTTDEGYKINKVKCKNDINSKLYVGQIIKKGNIICSDREKDIVEARYIIKKYLGLMLKRNLLILF